MVSPTSKCVAEIKDPRSVLSTYSLSVKKYDLRDSVDVYECEITLRVGKEAITFNLDQTSRYTANYNHMTANRIDVIELASEEYSQEVLGFSDSVAYGSSMTSQFQLEIDATYYDPEGDILILEALQLIC
ncbi:hypothetical protein Tco_0803445 [Tanacetum coccineum]|uniref:Reverse transcriptase domain-containing protein n=1 Tax=Tanacetum coccineum TaxID=301880 RepID=A0ABQ5A5Q1_9ASTR